MLAVGGVFMQLMLTCVEDSGQQNAVVARVGIQAFVYQRLSK